MNMRRFYTPGKQVMRKTKTPNGMGGYSESWSLFKTIDGCIRPLQGDERLSADKKTLFATHRLYCDYDTSILQTDRISDSGHDYEIKFINDPMQMHEFLHIDMELIT